MKKDRIIEVIQFINNLLVNKRYEELVLNDSKKLLSSTTMAKVINEYGGNISQPPIEAFQNGFDIYIVKENVEANVDFDLWIDNQRSDLTLLCNIINDNEVYKYSIRDIHIL